MCLRSILTTKVSIVALLLGFEALSLLVLGPAPLHASVDPLMRQSAQHMPVVPTIEHGWSLLFH